jgi:hypothetical protein
MGETSAGPFPHGGRLSTPNSQPPTPKELPTANPYDLRERLFNFASAGANYEEADDGSSPRDRRAKRQIALRELKETSSISAFCAKPGSSRPRTIPSSRNAPNCGRSSQHWSKGRERHEARRRLGVASWLGSWWLEVPWALEIWNWEVISQSTLRARIGSIRVARHAGTSAAISDAVTRAPVATPKTAGSTGATPKSWLPT